MEKLNWIKEDYFPLFAKSKDDNGGYPLELLVDDLHTNKERTVNHFLCHPGSEDFLFGLCNLLRSRSTRIAGNTAYIIGTFAESDVGCYRILGLVTRKQSRCPNILEALVDMLDFDDTETVMNAAGTMGTLAESNEGRDWVLSEPCLTDMIKKVNNLLRSDNIWTASNAALVMARLTIAEAGCSRILQHDLSGAILSHLVMALGVDEAGRGMNAAFALGRLCDSKEGLDLLLKTNEKDRMMGLLHRMLSAADQGASKNACFCLSCVAGSLAGHALVLASPRVDEILTLLSQLILTDEEETAWFAGMTLRTLASQPKGCLRLRSHPNVVPSLNNALSKCIGKSTTSEDLREECNTTLAIMKPPEKPAPPLVEIEGSSTMIITWAETTLKSGFAIKYQLFQDTTCVYDGPDRSFRAEKLRPNAQFAFKVRAYTEADRSQFSEPTVAHTEEAVPSEPVNLRALVVTTSQLKLAWEPPERPNGAIKYYQVHCGDKMAEQTTELSTIISGLHHNSTFTVSVLAATAKGKGPKTSLKFSTLEQGTHAPSKPTLAALGRSEIAVSWDPPEHPLGRITRYEVGMGRDRVVYAGTDTSCKVKGLSSDTEYTFTVTVITNEGKFESKPSRKRTAKDEYKKIVSKVRTDMQNSDAQRAPLYEPRRDSIDGGGDGSRRASVSSLPGRTKAPPAAASAPKSSTVLKENKGDTSDGNGATIQTPVETVVKKKPPAPAPTPPAPIPIKTMKLNRHPHAATTLEDVPPKPTPLVPPPPPPPPPASNQKASGAARPSAPESARPAVRYTTQKRRSLPDNSAKDSGAPAAKPSSAGAPARKIVSTVGVTPSRRRQNAASRGKAAPREESGAEQKADTKIGWSEPLDPIASVPASSTSNIETLPPSRAALDPETSVQPSQSRIQPTQPPTQPSQSKVETAKSPVQPIQSTQPIQSFAQSTQGPVQPTQPFVQPTLPAQSSVQPTQSVLQPALAADPDRLAPAFPHRSRTFIGGPPPNLGPRSRSLMRSMPPPPSPWAPDFPGTVQPPVSKAFVPLNRRSQSSLTQRAARSNSLPLTDLPGRSRTFIEVRNNQQLVGDDYVLRHRSVPVAVNPRSLGRVSGNEFLQ